jgi:TIR domain
MTIEPSSISESRLRIFISYSRDDLAFADQLYAALAACGFDPKIDRHGISGGEDWKKRLGALIQDSDTVVFVLSPSALDSKMCAWEVVETDRHGKRLIPIVAKPLADARVPARLKELNYIYFYPEANVPGSGFGLGLSQLVEALNTDLDWIRELLNGMTRVGPAAAFYREMMSAMLRLGLPGSRQRPRMPHRSILPSSKRARICNQNKPMRNFGD